MAHLLFVGTHVTIHPTRASLSFLSATGPLAGKIDAPIALLGEAAYRITDEIARTVLPVDFKPLTEPMEACRTGGVPINNSGSCSVARGVTESDLQGRTARFMDAIIFAELCSKRSTVTF